jgi:hypothetical protein
LENNAAGSGAMPTSTSKVFCRVDRRRPCRICGKPDWRSYTRDGERISICMRVNDGRARSIAKAARSSLIRRRGFFRSFAEAAAFSDLLLNFRIFAAQISVRQTCHCRNLDAELIDFIKRPEKLQPVFSFPLGWREDASADH